MTPEQLSASILDSLTALTDAGTLNLPDGAPATVVVERPKNREHGDYATNVALQLGKKAGLRPRDLADLLAERLRATDGIASVDIAGPGFLNIRVQAGAQGVVASQIADAGASYGSSDLYSGEKVNLEFVSANPTGPITLASARWAAVGDSIARLLELAGPTSPASTTSTTTGRRSTVSRAPCWRGPAVRLFRRTGTPASTSTR